MKHRFRYCTQHSDELIRQLENAGIKYSYNTDLGLVVYYLFVGQPTSEAIWPYIRSLEHGSEIESMIFTEKERESAPWLHLRTTSQKVEPPDHGRVCIPCTSRSKPLCYSRELRLPILTTRRVRWAKNQFFCSDFDLGFNELFCSDEARTMLESAELPLSFQPVMYEGKGTAVPDLHFIQPLHTLPAEAIDLSALPVQSQCSVCGQTTYNLYGAIRLSIREDYLDADKMIYTTPRIFGPGGASTAMIISQEVYQFLKKQNMLRSLHAEPVVLLPREHD